MPRSLPALLVLSAACATPPALSRPPEPLRFVNGVRAVWEDLDGNFWFGSHNEGAARWDGVAMRYFTVEDGLADGQVRTIQEGPDGALWFECGRGLSHWDGARLQVVPDRDYTHLDDWRADAGDLWFKSDEATGVSPAEGVPGVYLLQGDVPSWRSFPLVPGAEGAAQLSLTGLTRTTDGTVWFATYGAVIGHDGDDFVVLDDQALGTTAIPGYLHVRSIFGDSRGRLWIGNNGIGVWLRENGVTRPFEPAEAPPALQRVFAIGEDGDGGIWFGTRDDGAFRFDGETLTHFGPAEGLACQHLWSFHRDRHDTLWATGANPSGVFRFDGQRFEQVF